MEVQESSTKRPRLERQAERPPRAPPPPPPLPGNFGTPVVEWTFQLGTFEAVGWSTTKVGADQRFATRCEGPGNSLRPLLTAGDRLELRWAPEAKKGPRGRPGTVEATAGGREGGSIRFDAHGMEVGRFPAAVARALVPLLLRRLIDVEAFVGPSPPRAVELGTNVPLVVRVFLRSAALSAPGNSVVGPGQQSLADAGDKAKSKSQKIQKEEANREVLQATIGQLLELLRLPRRRAAVADDSANVNVGPDHAAGRGNNAGEGGPNQGGGADGDEEEEVEDMTREAAAQLGGSDALERSQLPAFRVPADLFASKLRHYQAQAVYWMWQKENPTSKAPAAWLQGGGGDACGGGSSSSSNSPEQQRGATAAASTNGQQGDASERPLHPMWDEYELPMQVGPWPGRVPARFIYHHRTTGALSLDFPDAALAHCRGGILADDMGLGKTVMCLALLALDSAQGLPSARTAAPELRALEDDAPLASRSLTSFFPQSSDDGVGGQLVIAPLSLIRQWHAEAKRHLPPERCPTVLEYHGGGRHCTPEKLRTYGLVLTTYGTLSSEKEDGPLFQVYWRRVVLDEAHAIKNRCSRQAQAAFRLRTFCRWCVTGTPLQNSVEELYSLVRFLRVDPWSTWSVWRKSIAVPLEKGRLGDGKAMGEALDMARSIVQPLLLRRTKGTLDPRTGKPLLELPPKHVHVLDIQLSVAEREFYDALYKKAQTQFDALVARGEAMAKITHILQLILKLRQALCHPFLVFAREKVPDLDLKSLEERCFRDMAGGQGVSEKFISNLLEDLRKGELADCPICCDVPEDPTMTPCGHVFCRECALKIPRQCGGECPVCRKPGVDRKTLRVLPGASRFPSKLLAGAGAEGSKEGVHSTKMRELLSLLKADMAAGRRAVVFSQWTSFLDLIGPALDAAGANWQRFDGSLSLDDRQRRVAWLSEADPPNCAAGRVLLVSLKSGGTGLNLVAANRLYLLDLWWNPAVEEQAIQRVHRIGQTKEVHVYKFVVANSIDEDLLDLHRAKERLLEDAIRGGRHQETATKLTIDDLKRIFNPCRNSLRQLRTGEGRENTMQATSTPAVASTASARPAAAPVAAHHPAAPPLEPGPPPLPPPPHPPPPLPSEDAPRPRAAPGDATGRGPGQDPAAAPQWASGPAAAPQAPAAARMGPPPGAAALAGAPAGRPEAAEAAEAARPSPPRAAGLAAAAGAEASAPPTACGGASGRVPQQPWAAPAQPGGGAAPAPHAAAWPGEAWVPASASGSDGPAAPHPREAPLPADAPPTPALGAGAEAPPGVGGPPPVGQVEGCGAGDGPQPEVEVAACWEAGGDLLGDGGPVVCRMDLDEEEEDLEGAWQQPTQAAPKWLADLRPEPGRPDSAAPPLAAGGPPEAPPCWAAMSGDEEDD